MLYDIYVIADESFLRNLMLKITHPPTLDPVISDSLVDFSLINDSLVTDSLINATFLTEWQVEEIPDPTACTPQEVDVKDGSIGENAILDPLFFSTPNETGCYYYKIHLFKILI